MAHGVPSVTTAQMQRIDAHAAVMGISSMQLMEHAGHRVAAFVRDRTKAKRIRVLAGKGNNGGDGLVAARFLHAWGFDVRVSVMRKMHPLPAQHWNTLRKLGVLTAGRMRDADLIVDALLGYAKENPRGAYVPLIQKANDSGIPILAVDVPSGLDADTGRAYTPCITATWTVTLALPKKGLVNAKMYVGDLWVADIGIPPEAYASLRLKVRFPSDCVRLTY